MMSFWKSRKWMCAGAVAAMLVSQGTALGQEETPAEERRPATATFLGDTGLWFVPTAEVLPHRTFSVSAQRANFDRPEGVTDIEHNPLTFAVGLADRVELFGSFRMLSRIDRDVNPLFDPTGSQVGGIAHEAPLATSPYSGNNAGDLVLGGKVNLLSEATLSPFALAVRGLITLPTGDEDAGNTSGKPDGAFDLVVSKDYGPLEVAAYGGFGIRGDPDGIDLPNGVRWGLGTGIPLGTPFKLFGEVSGELLTDDAITLDVPMIGTDGSRSALVSPVSNPVDLTLGLQWNGVRGVYVGAGLNYAAVHDVERAGLGARTGDRLGFLVRIGYHPGVKVYAPPPPPPPPPPANRPPTVTLSCEPCELMVSEISQLRADASDPDGDVLTYRWSAPTGTLQGEANRSTRGWQAPDEAGSVPVSVTVDDGRGGTASDTVTVRVNAPPPPPVREYVFEDVHFDFDRYTLRQGAVRVLDEVVAAMQEDATLSIQIDGHTCNIGTAEYNLALGERRANSVEEYLTGRGISGTRLQTISYGEERPQHDNTREETRRLNRRSALTVRLQ